MKLQKLLNGRSCEASLQPSPATCRPNVGNEEHDEVLSSYGGLRVKTPSEYDVVFGRGKPYQGHPGNVRLHRLADSYKKKYSSARRHEKTEIAAEIVTRIKTEEKKGGRFLKRSDVAGDDHWVEVSDSVARDKVSHALRGKNRKDENSTAIPMKTNEVPSDPKKRVHTPTSASQPTPKKQRLSKNSDATLLQNSILEQRLLNSMLEQRRINSMPDQRNSGLLMPGSNSPFLGGSLEIELQARQLMSSILTDRHLAAFGRPQAVTQFGFNNLLRGPGTQRVPPVSFSSNLLQALRTPQGQLDPRQWF